MIDVHVHVNWNGMTYDDVIEHMDKLGVDPRVENAVQKVRDLAKKGFKGGKLLKVLQKYPNVHADLSAESGLNAIQRDPEFTVKFIREFYNKLLYGTDCFTSEHLDYLLSLHLDENILEDILHNNAASLVKP